MPPTIPSKITPETRLLICCARTRLSPEITDEIRSLAAGPLNWDAVIASATQHSVTPLLERHLRAAASDLVPAAPMDRLIAATREGAFRSLKLTGELVKVLAALAAKQIVALPYKGPVASVQAYGDVSLRSFEDVDILTPQQNITVVHEVMTKLGYRPSLAWIRSSNDFSSIVPGEYKYYREDCDAIVEFHTEQTLRHFPVVPDLEDFARRGVRIALSGREILTLCPEDALVALCIHGSKDFWARLLWIADVSELIESRKRLDWDRVTHRAAALRAQRMLRLGTLLAERVLGAPVPREGRLSAREEDFVQSLALEIEEKLLPGSAPLNSAARFAFRRRSVPGSLTGWRYAMRLTMAPAQDDLEMVRLPRGFQPLYMLLRPLRLLLKSH
jgi:hypothetical protein